MKKIIQTLFSLLLFQALAFGQQEVKTNDGRTVLLYDDGTWLYADSIPLYNIKATNITNLEIPKTNPRDKIITHTGYSLLYNEKHEQASWVAYDLTKEETNKLYERTNKFIIDPKVRKGSANDRDYEGSGYDRGHLAPASDMGWSSTTMAESFYYSNMSPQTPSFNRGIWKKLEELVRSWAIENNSVYVITGPVLTDDLETIGPNEVSIPNYYYKVILDYSEPNIKGIGFILPNIGSKEPLQTYAVSIDSVEKVTGINFFPLLEDEQEELIENTLCVKCWSWMNTKSANKKNENNENKVTESTQCNGITKAGHRCKRKTLNASGYCYSHETQLNGDDSKSKTEENCSKPTYSGSTSTQCTGTTKKGSRCRRMTSSSSGRCYQH